MINVAAIRMQQFGVQSYQASLTASDIDKLVRFEVLSYGQQAEAPVRGGKRRGTPSKEIVRYAKERDIDLIVMGTHGRGLLAHAVMGSVTEKVVRNAPCPVLTLPWWSFALAVESPRSSEVISAPIRVLACA